VDRERKQVINENNEIKTRGGAEGNAKKTIAKRKNEKEIDGMKLSASVSPDYSTNF
jgi:hypothetical protein